MPYKLSLQAVPFPIPTFTFLAYLLKLMEPVKMNAVPDTLAIPIVENVNVLLKEPWGILVIERLENVLVADFSLDTIAEPVSIPSLKLKTYYVSSFRLRL